MAGDRNFFRNAAPLIMELERRAPWGGVDARKFRGVATLILAATVLVVGLIGGRGKVVTNAYEITELRARRDRLMSEHLRLERRIAEMRSLAYVEATARGRLGMVDINPNRVITLHEESGAGRLADRLESLFTRAPSSGSAPRTP